MSNSIKIILSNVNNISHENFDEIMILCNMINRDISDQYESPIFFSSYHFVARRFLHRKHQNFSFLGSALDLKNISRKVVGVC
jgi:hypothetical protein